MDDRFVDPAVCARALRAAAGRRRARALARHQARIGRVEEVLVEGPSKKDPTVISGRTAQHKLVHFRPAGARCGRDLRHRRGHRRRPHHLMGELREVIAEPTHQMRIPSPPVERSTPARCRAAAARRGAPAPAATRVH